MKKLLNVLRKKTAEEKRAETLERLYSMKKLDGTFEKYNERIKRGISK